MPTEGLLQELTALLAHGRDRILTAKAVAEAIRRAGAYRWTGIYEVDLQKGVVSNIAWSGSGAPAYPTFPVTNGLTSRAIATKKPINVGNVANDPDYLTALPTTRSELIIPILDATGDHVLGTIDVESEQAHAFDSATQAHLEECANVLRAFWKA